MIENYRITSRGISLSEFNRKEISKNEDQTIKENLLDNEVQELKELHLKLHAEGKRGIVVVLQAKDAAGKDEIIKYIFSNLLPQGLKITSFGKPTTVEQKHDYLWRMYKGLPERGQIGILNRSYYEDIIAPKVHDILENSDLPSDLIEDDIWKKRHRQIRDYEQYLCENGFPVLKFFFHVSKETQKERLLERMKHSDQHWEFSFSDIEERQHWDTYQKVFEEMINETATELSPWYILPADNPWLSRQIATQALLDVLHQLDPQFPDFDEDEKARVKEAIEQLEKE